MIARKWCVEKRDMKEIRRGEYEREERLISSTCAAELRSSRDLTNEATVTRWTLIKRDTEELKQEHSSSRSAEGLALDSSSNNAECEDDRMGKREGEGCGVASFKKCFCNFCSRLSFPLSLAPFP